MSWNPCNNFYSYCPPRPSSRPPSTSCSRETTSSNSCKPYSYCPAPCVPCPPPRRPEPLLVYVGSAKSPPPPPKSKPLPKAKPKPKPKKRKPSCDVSCDGSVKRVSIETKPRPVKNDDSCSLLCPGGDSGKSVSCGDGRPSSAGSCDTTVGSCTTKYLCTCKACPIPACRDQKNRKEDCPCEAKVVWEPQRTCEDKSVCTPKIDFPPCLEPPKRVSKCPGCGYSLSPSSSCASRTESSCSGCGWPKTTKCPGCGRKKTKANICSSRQSQESYCIQNKNFSCGMDSNLPTCINLQSAIPKCTTFSTGTKGTCRHGVPYRCPSTSRPPSRSQQPSTCSLPTNSTCPHGYSYSNKSQSCRTTTTNLCPVLRCPYEPKKTCSPPPSCPYAKSVTSNICSPQSNCSHFINILTNGNQVMACNISSFSRCK